MTTDELINELADMNIGCKVIEAFEGVCVVEFYVEESDEADELNPSEYDLAPLVDKHNKL
jgi:hypothetical protein